MALSLCLHRDEETKRLEAKDVLFALKKAYGITIPGYRDSSTVSYVSSLPSEAHTKRMKALKDNKTKSL